jgi:hypothetical protein
MPIMQEKPHAKPSKQPDIPQIQPPRANTVVVDNKTTPITSLMTHVAGIAMINDYYRLVVNKDNVLYAQDVGQSGVDQQYIKYRNFEIRMQGSLSEDQQEDDKVFTMQGTGYIHSGFIPNEGDMFVTDVGDGRRGVFNITRSKRMSIRIGTVYEVSYSLAYFVGDKPSQFDDLEGKVIETYFYVKEMLGYNQNPFLSSEEYNFSRTMANTFRDMCQMFHSSFFSKEFAAYVLPGQNVSTFDYFLYRAQRSIFRDDPFGVMRKHQSINIADEDIIARKMDLFSVLIERNATKFKICDRRVGYARTDQFFYDGVTTNIRYTGISALVYPDSKEIRTDEFNNRLGKGFLSGPLTPTPNTLEDDVLEHQITDFMFGGKRVPLIKLVSVDDYYVFSEDFYKRTENLSVLEAQVLQYIDGKEVNPQALKVLLENYIYWPRLERFYYIPVLLILIMSVMKAI